MMLLDMQPARVSSLMSGEYCGDSLFIDAYIHLGKVRRLSH